MIFKNVWEPCIKFVLDYVRMFSLPRQLIRYVLSAVLAVFHWKVATVKHADRF